MMRVLFTFFFTLAASAAAIASLPIEIEAEGAILINGSTGAILFEKKSREQFFPASITKISTALYALEVGKDNLSTMIEADGDVIASLSQEAKRQANYTVPAWWLEPGNSHIGIKKGEKLSLNDLIHAMLIASGNDAANMVAKYVGGNIPQFMLELNSFLRSLGLEKTHFYNPHGLHHPDHKTTAYDMALLTKEALNNPDFCTIVASTRCLRPKTNKQEATTLIQTNELIRPGRKHYYSKAIGVKTGFTALAQHNLVAAARDKGRTLIAVLLKNKERSKMFSDAKKLFEAAFNQPKIRQKLVEKGVQPFETMVDRGDKPIKTFTSKSLEIEFYPAEEPKLRCFLVWDQLKLPIEKGERVGALQFFEGELLAHSEPLFSQEKVEEKRGFFGKMAFWGILLLVAAAILLFFFAKR